MLFPRYLLYAESFDLWVKKLQNVKHVNCLFSSVQVCQAEKEESEAQHNPTSHVVPSDHSHFRTIHRQAPFDIENADSPATVVRPEPQIGTNSSVPHEVFHSSNTQLDNRVVETHGVTLQSTDDSQPWTAVEIKDRVRCIDNKAETSTTPRNTIHETDPANSPASTIVPIESTETRDSYIVSDDSKSQASTRVTFSEGDGVKVLEAETVINSVDLINSAPKPIAQSSQDDSGEPEEEAGLESFMTNQNAENAVLTPTLEATIKSEDQMVLAESSKSTDPQDKRKGSRLKNSH